MVICEFRFYGFTPPRRMNVKTAAFVIRLAPIPVFGSFREAGRSQNQARLRGEAGKEGVNVYSVHWSEDSRCSLDPLKEVLYRGLYRGLL